MRRWTIVDAFREEADRAIRRRVVLFIFPHKKFVDTDRFQPRKEM